MKLCLWESKKINENNTDSRMYVHLYICRELIIINSRSFFLISFPLFFLSAYFLLFLLFNFSNFGARSIFIFFFLSPPVSREMTTAKFSLCLAQCKKLHPRKNKATTEKRAKARTQIPVWSHISVFPRETLILNSRRIVICIYLHIYVGAWNRTARLRVNSRSRVTRNIYNIIVRIPPLLLSFFSLSFFCTVSPPLLFPLLFIGFLFSFLSFHMHVHASSFRRCFFFFFFFIFTIAFAFCTFLRTTSPDSVCIHVLCDCASLRLIVYVFVEINSFA